MKHSVFFGDGTTHSYGREMGMFRGVNTWEDWHLIPAAKPIIATPEVYTNYVDLPAAHGKLDLSEYLTGGPVYKNRSGSLEFFMASGYGFWAETVNQICNMLHGKKLYMVLDDEPQYFYHGRFSVQQPKSDSGGGKDSLTINYELDPFKFLLPRNSPDEFWDRFLLDDLHKYKYMEKINASQNVSFSIPGYTNGFMLDAFISESSPLPASVTVSLNGESITLTKESRDSGTIKSGALPPVINSMNTVTVSGTGLVDLVCYGGHL